MRLRQSASFRSDVAKLHGLENKVMVSCAILGVVNPP